ncbi:winged helix-turn-helix domain-containing protein [Foetidibacter luteolus]|uniref:winged helix-turn-helix domain-containing protein n=1 Tax=Foetidibacter luteolus TaxID=2608880 RepID=UPI00129BD2E4|nr:helix-turn-helix domain-containing protein [Foetidibacter luteolus]
MKYFARMKPFTLIGSSALLIILLIFAVAFISSQHETPEKHVEVVLRNLGHQLLLAANDSTSRVLPIKKTGESTYQVSFQQDFRLISDTLINLVQRTFKKNALPTEYIVSLKNCKQNETVFAFEINSHTGDLKGCRGRKLEVGCYIVEIDFLKKDPSNFSWLLLLIVPLSLVGLYVKNKFGKKDAKEPVVDTTDYIQLGSFRFYADNNVLKTENDTITLSEKETKALKIFAENSNQIVEREQLMKEIWEDKGLVVISRNVDVLVSKLRKKLSGDSSIKFINVPGRGYKFVVE